MPGPAAPRGPEPAERWRTPSSAPVLEVSNLGRVRKAGTAQILTPRVVHVKRTRPRLQVAYEQDFVKRYRRVARLVCEAFHGDPPPGHVAMFIDGDSFNCHADNLRWATRAEVSRATVDRGRHRSGQQILAERRRQLAGETGSAPAPGRRRSSRGDHPESGRIPAPVTRTGEPRRQGTPARTTSGVARLQGGVAARRIPRRFKRTGDCE